MCPLCGKPLLWKRTDLDEWVPCDEEPVLFVAGGTKKLFKKHELLEDCEVFNPLIHRDVKPQYALIPHFYTCSELKKERAEWARQQRYAGTGR